MTLLTNNNYYGGFIYHPKSQQILLQKDSSDQNSTWTLIDASDGKIFGQKLCPIYDYPVNGGKHFISYAEIKKLQEFSPIKNLTFGWFPTAKISKIPLSAQTKQDIVVGKRVIDSATRKKSGERTIG